MDKKSEDAKIGINPVKSTHIRIHSTHDLVNITVHVGDKYISIVCYLSIHHKQITS